MTATDRHRHLARAPRALCDGDDYRDLRMTALDTVAAISCLASDSKRHGDAVFAALGRAAVEGTGVLSESAKDIVWEPLEISTSLAELGTVVGHRRRPADVRAELAAIAATVDPDGAPLITWTERGRALTVTISAWWHSAARGGVVRSARIVPSAYASLPPLERRAYFWLAGWVGIDASSTVRRIGIDTLVAHLWPDPPPTPTAARQRRRRTRVAVGQLNVLPDHGWIFARGPSTVTVLARRRERPAPASASVAPRTEEAS